jgi:hypothetical protein
MLQNSRKHIMNPEWKVETLGKEIEVPDLLPSVQIEREIDVEIAKRPLAHMRKVIEVEQNKPPPLQKYRQAANDKDLQFRASPIVLDRIFYGGVSFLLHDGS